MPPRKPKFGAANSLTGLTGWCIGQNTKKDSEMNELKTKDDYIFAHRLLWDWLAKHPDMEKKDWPGWGHNSGQYAPVQLQCFPCEWSEGCDSCLLVWPGGVCVRNKSLFYLWNYEEDPTRRAELARQIRDLPVREDME
jgi:hypothetical protein